MVVASNALFAALQRGDEDATRDAAFALLSLETPLTASPQLQFVAWQVLQRLSDVTPDDEDRTAKLRQMWRGRVGRYKSEMVKYLGLEAKEEDRRRKRYHANSFEGVATEVAGALERAFGDAEDGYFCPGGVQPECLRDSAAVYRIELPNGEAALGCEGPHSSKCANEHVVHHCMPWVNPRQLQHLTLFELDHVVEQNALKKWVSEQCKQEARRRSTGAGQRAVNAVMLMRLLCTPMNLRLCFRHPCHDRRRHATSVPAGTSLFT